MRLRQNLTQEDFAFWFDMERSTVSRMINQLLAHHLKASYTTDAPCNHMPNTVGIIYETEIFIQRPSNLHLIKQSFHIQVTL